MRLATFLAGVCSLGLLLIASGCSSQSSAGDSRATEWRSRLVLAAEPDGALPISEAKLAATGGGPMVVFGQIGAGTHDPWDPDRAAFLLGDPAAALSDDEKSAHGHHHAGHDHDNCPFCKKETAEAEAMTIVEFVDDQGQVIGLDARKLLGVTEGQLVVVQGRASIDGLGNLVVKANGIYIRE